MRTHKYCPGTIDKWACDNHEVLYCGICEFYSCDWCSMDNEEPRCQVCIETMFKKNKDEYLFCVECNEIVCCKRDCEYDYEVNVSFSTKIYKNSETLRFLTSMSILEKII